MRGLMMDNYPLTLDHLLRRVNAFFSKKEVATKQSNGIHRTTYGAIYGRCLRLMSALKRAGVKPGNRVASFSWNHSRHLELYLGVPAMGAVMHTVNIRLGRDQIAYIMNHAADTVVCVDETLLPVLEPIASKLKTVKKFVVIREFLLDSKDSKQSRPLTTSLPRAVDYEEFIGREAPRESFPKLRETDACGLCYTSGTTGHPKGVLYSHRSLFLHTLACATTDVFRTSESDIALAIVPMFHANCWGFPYIATMMGCKLVFPGPFLQPRDLCELIQKERVTVTSAVPTIWIGVGNLLETESFDLSSLRSVLVGGSAVPPRLIETFDKKYGIPIVHAWGMTETAPLGTVCRLKSTMQDWDEQKKLAVRAKQGFAQPGIELRVVDRRGKIVPSDGVSRGEIQVRGPWVASSYYRDKKSTSLRWARDGWFRTGDVATIDEEGYIQISDRIKDVIKSGGEWISSVELENGLMSHPKVLEAAVIAVAHPRWQERPLACVVPREVHKNDITKVELLEFLAKKFPKWWLPDDVVFLNALPKTSVGKFNKRGLREQFQNYVLPATSPGEVRKA